MARPVSFTAAQMDRGRALLAEGKSVRAVARELGVGDRTVARHLTFSPERVKKHNAANLARTLKSHYWRNYGISREEKHRREASQGGLCAICEKARPLVVDHDHQTGAIRGLICSPCNLGLGKLGDTLAVLKRAVAYLEQAALSDAPSAASPSVRAEWPEPRP